MNLDRIAHPLRLAKGSHQPGSGKGCAMNAISYIGGDTQITDFPATSARPLAAFVQLCNDLLAGPDGYLSPENSFLALELGWQTVGTAEVPDNVIHAWVAELLTSPSWGVVQYADNAAAEAIFDIADLHRALASGAMPAIPAWYSADNVARAVCATLAGAGLYAVRAAYQSTALVDTEHCETLDAVTGNALRAHELATESTGPPGSWKSPATLFAHGAIWRSWTNPATSKQHRSTTPSTQTNSGSRGATDNLDLTGCPSGQAPTAMARATVWLTAWLHEPSMDLEG